ncbi:ribosome assembly RNA-binding protein YhbY [Bhargavaea beijingensis]|uniref:RNA-binding protein n=1 Tax=Bhargavaea beijingensis TaxID=426756 RepID=A0A1G7CNQ0_9BACL|nr:ribosome assembly RNA-binding protein YhbY [Bhargavaea beijingensis]MCW1927055.1 ribosome assembly RNA-binding protein YhbY [Bhargavaea beijingensis]RSK30785.1 ribosome assembly RNA-binding protein YhbY [Bhargavaea beijingensis]SDE40843.1 RNA-binding protein [Bhargavaea beijingensis]
MLTGKQKRFLRSEAHHLQPVFQVGKQGVNDELISGISEALEKRELIKVAILQNAPEEKEDVAQRLSERTRAELVQVIGKTIVLYRESRDNKRLVLPGE